MELGPSVKIKKKLNFVTCLDRYVCTGEWARNMTQKGRYLSDRTIDDEEKTDHHPLIT